MYRVGDKIVTIKTDLISCSIKPGTVGIIKKPGFHTRVDDASLYWIGIENHVYLYQEDGIKPYNDFKKKYLLLEQILNNI